MRLVVVIGPPGAGKSTYLATERRPGDAAVDFDLLAQALGSDLSHDAPPTVGKIAFAARQAAIARAFDSLTGEKDPLPGDVWVIASNLDDATRAEWQAKGAEIVVLDPGYDVVMQRLRDDGRPQASFDAAEAWYAAHPSTAAAKEAPMLEMKSATLVVDEALEDGQFTAYASVFDVIDLDGDIVRKGAFAGIEDDGAGIPVYWAHRLDDPHMNIGATLSAVEDDHGLKTLTQLDLESQTAAYAHRLVVQRRVKQLSYTYSVLEYRLIEVDGKTVREILRVKLHEISLVPIGANQMTEVLAAKAGITTKTTADAAEDVEHDDAEEHEVEEPDTAKTEAKAAHARARIALAELGI